MTDCIFCKIVSKQAPGKVIYEDDQVLALVPKESVSKGHTLLIPKEHFESVLDTPNTIMEVLGLKMKEISIRLIKDNQATAINILNASGKDAQQSVMHLHFHLVPRYPNDGLDMWIKQSL